MLFDIVDLIGFYFNNDLCDAHGYTAHKRIEDPASPSYISHAARRKDHLYRREDASARRTEKAFEGCVKRQGPDTRPRPQAGAGVCCQRGRV